MYETDNFAYIIKVRRDRDEATHRMYERWREMDEANRRSLPWCWAIVIAVILVISVLVYFDPGGSQR
jgi:hypothetical protein